MFTLKFKCYTPSEGKWSKFSLYNLNENVLHLLYGDLISHGRHLCFEWDAELLTSLP